MDGSDLYPYQEKKKKYRSNYPCSAEPSQRKTNTTVLLAAGSISFVISLISFFIAFTSNLYHSVETLPAYQLLWLAVSEAMNRGQPRSTNRRPCHLWHLLARAKSHRAWEADCSSRAAVTGHLSPSPSDVFSPDRRWFRLAPLLAASPLCLTASVASAAAVCTTRPPPTTLDSRAPRELESRLGIAGKTDRSGATTPPVEYCSREEAGRRRWHG